MSTIVTEHLNFDLQTQLQLDRLWQSWSRFDKHCAENGYGNEAQNGRCDALWTQYQDALDMAYRAKAEAEVPAVIAEYGQQMKAAIAAAGLRQLSQRLTTRQRMARQSL